MATVCFEGPNARGARAPPSVAVFRRSANWSTHEPLVMDDVEADCDGRDGFFVLSATPDLKLGLDLELPGNFADFDLFDGECNEQPSDELDMCRIRTREVWSPCQSATPDSPFHRHRDHLTSPALDGCDAMGVVVGVSAASPQQSLGDCGSPGHLDLPPLVKRLLRPRTVGGVATACEAAVSSLRPLPSPHGLVSGGRAADGIADVADAAAATARGHAAA